MRHEVVSNKCNKCLGVPGDSLTLECPGVQLSSAQLRRVSQGLTDFRMGEWWDKELVVLSDGLTTTAKKMSTAHLDEMVEAIRALAPKLKERMIQRVNQWQPSENAAAIFRTRLLQKLQLVHDVDKFIKLCVPYYSALRAERARRDSHMFDAKLEIPCTSGQLYALNRKAQEAGNTLANWARLTLLRALRK